MATSTANTLELAVRDLILSNAKINDAVNGRIYLGHIPAYPLPKKRLIIVTGFNREPYYHLGGELAKSTTLVQIDVWATDPDGMAFVGNNTSSAGEQIRKTLSGYSGVVGSVGIDVCLLERDMYDSIPPEDGSDAWSRRRSLDFNITHSITL